MNRVGHESGLLGIKRDGHQKGLASKKSASISRHQSAGIKRPGINRGIPGKSRILDAKMQIFFINKNQLKAHLGFLA